MNSFLRKQRAPLPCLVHDVHFLNKMPRVEIPLKPIQLIRDMTILEHGIYLAVNHSRCTVCEQSKPLNNSRWW